MTLIEIWEKLLYIAEGLSLLLGFVIAVKEKAIKPIMDHRSEL